MRLPIVLGTLLLAAASWAGSPERIQQTIVKGKSAAVRLPFAPGAGANSNPDVVQGKVDGKSILLFARKPGEATYTVWSKDKKRSVEIDVVVSERDMARILRELESALAEFEQVTVSLRDGDVVVEGEVATLEELDRVNRIVSRYEGPGVRNDIGGR